MAEPCPTAVSVTPTPAIEEAAGALWFAIQTRARHEKWIEDELGRKGITAYVPTTQETHRWSDRNKIVDVPLFSCYVFVKMQVAASSRLEVLKTPGVFRFVSVKGAPAPIPYAQIESLQKVLNCNVPVAACDYLKPGQRVRIRGGSLDGIEGTLVGNRGGHKLILSVELIHQSVTVTIDNYAVEPVDLLSAGLLARQM